MSVVAAAVVVTAAVSEYQRQENEKAAKKAREAQEKAAKTAAQIAQEQLDFERKKYADEQKARDDVAMVSESEYAAQNARYQSFLDKYGESDPNTVQAYQELQSMKGRLGEGRDVYENQAIQREQERHDEQMALYAERTRLEQERHDEQVRIANERYQYVQKTYQDAQRFAGEVYAEQKELVMPYVEGGESAYMSMQAISGLAGPEAQQQEIEMIQTSPGFYEMIQEGENAILQNASATGGVRGGDTQAFLAKYRPQMLREALQDKYNMYGGIATMGQEGTRMGVNALGQKGANLVNAAGSAAAAAAGTIPGSGNIIQQPGTGAIISSGPQAPVSSAGINNASTNLANTYLQQGENQANYELGMGNINANQYNWVPQTMGFLAAYNANKPSAPLSSNNQYYRPSGNNWRRPISTGTTNG